MDTKLYGKNTKEHRMVHEKYKWAFNHIMSREKSKVQQMKIFQWRSCFFQIRKWIKMINKKNNQNINVWEEHISKNISKTYHISNILNIQHEKETHQKWKGNTKKKMKNIIRKRTSSSAIRACLGYKPDKNRQHPYRALMPMPLPFSRSNSRSSISLFTCVSRYKSEWKSRYKSEWKGEVGAARKSSLHVHREASLSMQGRVLKARGGNPTIQPNQKGRRRRVLEAIHWNEVVNEINDG